MGKILFGTAGLPHCVKGYGSVAGIKKLPYLNLDAMELEFVRGSFPGDKTSGNISVAAAKAGITLTAHAPYYINLSSEEPEKTAASVERILATARTGNLCGAVSCTFHPAFYQRKPHDEIYRVVERHLKTIIRIIRAEKNPITIRPELTGKPSQFGSFKEILKLSRNIEGVEPCIDFAHHHARTANGNTYEAFASMLKEMDRTLGSGSLQNMHIHVSGVEYGPKGEKRHLNLRESDMNFRDLLHVLADFNAGGVLICESPNLEDDALLLKEIYEGW